MSQVTIFIPLYDGLYDDEYGPHIYQGHLSESQILKIGSELGGVGESYAAVAIEGTIETGWYVSYNHDSKISPIKSEQGASYFETEDSGCLAYQVKYQSVLPC